MHGKSRVSSAIMYDFFELDDSGNCILKPGFHKANFDHDNDRFQAKTKRLM